MSDFFDVLNSEAADLIDGVHDEQGQEAEKANQVEKTFKGRFNDCNGSLLLMCVGLLAARESLSATLGLGMFIMGQKLSEGENR